MLEYMRNHYCYVWIEVNVYAFRVSNMERDTCLSCERDADQVRIRERKRDWPTSLGSEKETDESSKDQREKREFYQKHILQTLVGDKKGMKWKRKETGKRRV